MKHFDELQRHIFSDVIFPQVVEFEQTKLLIDLQNELKHLGSALVNQLRKRKTHSFVFKKIQVVNQSLIGGEYESFGIIENLKSSLFFFKHLFDFNQLYQKSETQRSIETIPGISLNNPFFKDLNKLWGIESYQFL